MGRVALRVVLAAVLVVACSDDDDGGGSGGGDTRAFCDGLEALDQEVDGLSTEEGLRRLQDLNPPADIAEDWNFFVDVMVAAEVPDATDQEEAEQAFRRVSDYLIDECGVDINT